MYVDLGISVNVTIAMSHVYRVDFPWRTKTHLVGHDP